MDFKKWTGKSSAWTILLVLASLFFGKGGCVSCHTCVHYDVSSRTNALASYVLSLLRHLKDAGSEACSRPDVIPTEEDITECGSAPRGMRYMCGSTSGVAIARFNDEEFNVKFMERECVEVPEEDVSRYVNKCEDTNVLPPQVEALIDRVLPSLKFPEQDTDLSLDVKKCYDDSLGEIGDDVLKCPSCTWNTLDAQHDLVGTFLKILNIVNTEPCKMANPGDEEKVPKQTCRPSGSNAAQCGTVEGQFSSIHWDVEFTMSTLERGCLLLPRAEALSTDSCETKLPAGGAVRDLALRSLQSLDLTDLVFKGKICATTEARYSGIFSGSVFCRCELVVVGLCLLINTVITCL